LVDGNAAARAVPTQPGHGDQAVPQVKQLLWVQGQVLETVQHHPPDVAIARVTVVVPDEVGGYPAARTGGHDPIIDFGIEAHQEDIEVPSIRGAHCLARKPYEQQAA
jgi:hypothetical protein